MVAEDLALAAKAQRRRISGYIRRRSNADGGENDRRGPKPTRYGLLELRGQEILVIAFAARDG